MTEKDILPDVSDFEDVGRDHIRHRVSRSWVKEAFGMCAVAFGLGAYDCVRTFMLNGAPSIGWITLIVFGLSVTSVTFAYRRLGTSSTYSEDKRRSLRYRVVLAVVAAAIPIGVGIFGFIAQITRRIG